MGPYQELDLVVVDLGPVVVDLDPVVGFGQVGSFQAVGFHPVVAVVRLGGRFVGQGPRGTRLRAEATRTWSLVSDTRFMTRFKAAKDS